MNRIKISMQEDSSRSNIPSLPINLTSVVENQIGLLEYRNEFDDLFNRIFKHIDEFHEFPGCILGDKKYLDRLEAISGKIEQKEEELIPSESKINEAVIESREEIVEETEKTEEVKETPKSKKKEKQ